MENIAKPYPAMLDSWEWKGSSYEHADIKDEVKKPIYLFDKTEKA